MKKAEAIQIIEDCIIAEMNRGKSRIEAVDSVEKAAKELAVGGIEDELGIATLKMVFLDESPKELANGIISNLLNS